MSCASNSRFVRCKIIQEQQIACEFEDLLEPLHLSLYRLAHSLSLPPRRIKEIVHGKRAITADASVGADKGMAVRCMTAQGSALLRSQLIYESLCSRTRRYVDRPLAGWHEIRSVVAL